MGTDTAAPAEPTTLEVPTRVNPYSVIDITPFQEELPPPPDPDAEDDGASQPVASGYSVPVPCGYAVPCNLPLLLPAYSSPVVVRAASLDEEGSALLLSHTAGNGCLLFLRPAVLSVRLEPPEQTETESPVHLLPAEAAGTCRPCCGPRCPGLLRVKHCPPLAKCSVFYSEQTL